MTEEHLITPSPELIKDWCASKIYVEQKTPLHVHVATQAARWGADQELEACCVWVNNDLAYDFADRLRAARRPEPPNHKELALIALTALEACAAQSSDTTESVFYIRRALESLPD